MGLTSIKKEVTKDYALALIVGKDVTEASQENFFNKSKWVLASLFNYVEIFDNGKVVLCNSIGDFVTFE